MKAVLISIHPRHCENIASGKKTVEVRKTAPKIPAPFKCYIYETKDRRFENIAVCWNDGTPDFIHATGKVIGEFVCDQIDTVRDEGNGFVAGGVQASERYSAAQALIQAACLTEKELKAYLGNEYGYCWHVSDLKIYDMPKELWELCMRCNVCCANCKYPAYYNPFIVPGCEEKGVRKVMRPPQSWCYVEKV